MNHFRCLTHLTFVFELKCLTLHHLRYCQIFCYLSRHLEHNFLVLQNVYLATMLQLIFITNPIQRFQNCKYIYYYQDYVTVVRKFLLIFSEYGMFKYRIIMTRCIICMIKIVQSI